MGKYEWILYAVVAGLAWGTYVPLVGYGGKQLGGAPTARLLAILCIGVAYLLIGVLFPLFYLFVMTPAEQRPSVNTMGAIFAGCGGAAGAIGAICVVFATKAAPESQRLFIPPVIFGLAPILATLIGAFWHPIADSKGTGEPFHFQVQEALFQNWKLWAGVVLVGFGVVLVFLARGELEAAESKKSSSVTSSAPSNSASSAEETKP
jgi:hypothetical protein